MITSEEEAWAALRERLGSGARYDDPAAPAVELAWARRGTAYFSRKLNELRDDELDAPSLLPGWSRRYVIAHVGYNARALTRLTEWARTQVEHKMYPSPEWRLKEIEYGATLPPRALRHLCQHAEVHLNVEWRDLDAAAWDREVVTAQGRTVTARATPWMRTREVWLHAVDLDNGGSFLDFPPELLDRLRTDVLEAWERGGQSVDVVLAPTDGADVVLGAGGPTVSGRNADLVRWLTGRGARRLTSSTGTLPALPRWI